MAVWVEYQGHITQAFDVSWAQESIVDDETRSTADYAWKAQFYVPREFVHEIMTAKPMTLVEEHANNRVARNRGILCNAEYDSSGKHVQFTLSGTGIYAA